MYKRSLRSNLTPVSYFFSINFLCRIMFYLACTFVATFLCKLYGESRVLHHIGEFRCTSLLLRCSSVHLAPDCTPEAPITHLHFWCSPVHSAPNHTCGTPPGALCSSLHLRCTVELRPVVGLATGTILRAADARSARPHSTPCSTNKFVGALLEGVFSGPDGR